MKKIQLEIFHWQLQNDWLDNLEKRDFYFYFLFSISLFLNWINTIKEVTKFAAIPGNNPLFNFIKDDFNF